MAAKHGDAQGWIKTLEGLVMLIQTFGGELPFFFLSGIVNGFKDYIAIILWLMIINK